MSVDINDYDYVDDLGIDEVIVDHNNDYCDYYDFDNPEKHSIIRNHKRNHSISSFIDKERPKSDQTALFCYIWNAIIFIVISYLLFSSMSKMGDYITPIIVIVGLGTILFWLSVLSAFLGGLFSTKYLIINIFVSFFSNLIVISTITLLLYCLSFCSESNGQDDAEEEIPYLRYEP